MTVREVLIEEYNELMRQQGRDVRLVSECERKPRLAVDNVVKLEERRAE
jgi:hypothetical protein